MATVKPFRAVRPGEGYAERVAALPYDVMNRQEAVCMASGNPYSFLHVSRAEIDVPSQVDQYSAEVYEKGKENLAAFISKGVMVREPKPVFYVYRQVMGGRAQTGIVGCVAVDEYEDGTIKKHELTRVEKEVDRINHFDVCNANTEPVFLTYREDKRIKSLTEGFIANHEAEYDFTLADGVRHVLWRIADDNVIGSISNLFREIPSLYIADGHHRSASAYKVGVKRRGQNPGYDGSEEFNFFMAVVFPDTDLKIYDYNRAVKDLNGNTAEGFIGKIRDIGLTVEEKGKEAYAPERKHVFGMFLDGSWYKLSVPEQLIPDDVIESLDVSLLQDKILGPLLGIKDPRTDKRIDFIGGIRGLSELEKRVGSDMKVAFAVHPVDIGDLLKVSDNGKIMPPKSTWFEPKLASGLFLHEL
ncbi:MAG: DUF1015 family protein [Clostridiales bacterium]|nr:DUF1015 family protein [Clostridiales bacterium]